MVRGLIEFYLRWNNIVDQYGWSFIVESGGVRPRTSECTDPSTIMCGGNSDNVPFAKRARGAFVFNCFRLKMDLQGANAHPSRLLFGAT